MWERKERNFNRTRRIWIPEWKQSRLIFSGMSENSFLIANIQIEMSNAKLYFHWRSDSLSIEIVRRVHFCASVDIRLKFDFRQVKTKVQGAATT